MENMPGSFGTSASFVLRYGQTIFSAASLIIMCFGGCYFDFTTFFYLATVMSMVTSWSFSFALIDTYSVLVKQIPQEASVLSLTIPGDFVMSFLSLGGACGVASVTGQLLSSGEQICEDDLCNKYQVSAVLALMSWFLLLASALFNLWVLPSLYH